MDTPKIATPNMYIIKGSIDTLRMERIQAKTCTGACPATCHGNPSLSWRRGAVKKAITEDQLYNYVQEN